MMCPVCSKTMLSEWPHRHDDVVTFRRRPRLPDPTWTSAVDATGTQTFCGECGHPMHWHECGAGANLTAGPCRCRNDEAVPYRDTWANGRDSGFELRVPGPIPGSTLHVRQRDPEPVVEPIRGCSIISWVLLAWAVAALGILALVAWWAS
jgi:hypothetical protein